MSCRTLFAAGAVATASLTAQCATTWASGSALPGINGPVNAIVTWDPDGAGPQPPVRVVGGLFTFAANQPANAIATWDPASGAWSSLGGGLAGASASEVMALAVLANGDLVAGGNFVTSSGIQNLARWNGSTWSALAPLGSFDGAIRALAVLPNGDLVAGGSFTVVGGVACSCAARWDGVTWSPLAAGLWGTGPLQPPPTVSTLAVLPGGDLIAGGYFSRAGFVAASNIARWNGTSWSALDAGVSDEVCALTVAPNGDLLVGGRFTAVGSAFLTASRLARWNGTAWAPVASGFVIGGAFGSKVAALALLTNGDLIVGGTFTTVGAVTAHGIARWNGANWSAYGAGIQYEDVRALAVLPGGDVVAGGNYTVAGATTALNLARWDGAVWAAVQSGIAGVGTLLGLPNGDLVAGGTFPEIAGVPANNVARWDGTTWTALGGGLTPSATPWLTATCLAALPSGDLVVGGTFASAGGVPAQNIARWDGSTWWPLGGGLPPLSVRALTTLANGDLVAGGYFQLAMPAPGNAIARWDGTTWSPLGTGLNSGVHALATLPNGDVVAGGSFTTAGGSGAFHIARWDGSAWWPLGTGVGNGSVDALAVLANGDLVAGGQFTTAGGVIVNRVARWNGSGWSALGGGLPANVLTLTTLPNGDLLAGIDQAPGVMRWDGSTWSTAGGGTDGGVPCLALAGTEVAASGWFTHAGNTLSVYFARLVTTCPATAAVTGVGCPSSGGGNVLTAQTLPWVDATFRARASGLPGTALVVAVSGLGAIPQGVLPLQGLLAQASAGCDLLVTPDLLQLHVAANGRVDESFLLPSSPTIVGTTFHHQMVPLEVDAIGTVLQVTATNALALTVGSF